MKKAGFLIFYLLLIASCGVKKNKNVENNETKKHQSDFVAKIGILPDEYLETTINSVTIVGDEMRLNISYSGGCEEQAFELIGAEQVMKSLPPKRGVVLIRHANGDQCREWITKEITFQIQALSASATPGYETILILDNNQERYSYKRAPVYYTE